MISLTPSIHPLIFPWTSLSFLFILLPFLRVSVYVHSLVCSLRSKIKFICSFIYLPYHVIVIHGIVAYFI